jgi:hypothetical protein
LGYADDPAWAAEMLQRVSPQLITHSGRSSTSSSTRGRTGTTTPTSTQYGFSQDTGKTGNESIFVSDRRNAVGCWNSVAARGGYGCVPWSAVDGDEGEYVGLGAIDDQVAHRGSSLAARSPGVQGVHPRAQHPHQAITDPYPGLDRRQRSPGHLPTQATPNGRTAPKILIAGFTHITAGPDQQHMDIPCSE